MPKAFNNILRKDIIWRSNSKAWMIARYLMEYIQKCNGTTKSKSLFVDNATPQK